MKAEIIHILQTDKLKNYNQYIQYWILPMQEKEINYF